MKPHIACRGIVSSISLLSKSFSGGADSFAPVGAADVRLFDGRERYLDSMDIALSFSVCRLSSFGRKERRPFVATRAAPYAAVASPFTAPSGIAAFVVSFKLKNTSLLIIHFERRMTFLLPFVPGRDPCPARG